VAEAPRDGDTVEALLKAADERLYRAKAQGRNRIEA
jgi:PleD family two-component response regulator